MIERALSRPQPVKRLVIATAVTASCAALVVSCSQPTPQVTGQTPPAASAPGGTSLAADGISVSGVGEVSGAPDTLSITFGISLKRDTVSAAVADNAAVQAKMLDAIKAGGVTEKDIRTNNYNVSPSFDFVEGKQVPKGFQVTNSVVAKVHDLPKAGTLIDSATQAGGNDVQVQGVSFTLEDNLALLAGARDKAFANAKAKADQFAKLSGRDLGKVVSITESSSPRSYDMPAGAVAKTSSTASAPTQINPGQVTTNLQVEMRYSFA